ncbi:MAG: carboxypeptidase M32 [Ruminococcus sp.]|nr:carboxypeptidase M32 [Ruminococcus sp.]
MQEFFEYQKEIANIQYTINLLLWELRIIAPKDSQKDLIDLISFHERKLFELQTSDYYGKLLKELMSSSQYQSLEDPEKRYINNLLRHYKNHKKIPIDFYEVYSKEKKIANTIWKDAKEQNNYKLFEPQLEKIIELTKKYYRYLAPDTDNIYDIMLNEFESGINSEIIDRLFSELKEGIINLMPRETNDNEIANFKFTEQQLIECANYLLNYIGFDLNKGIVDIYAHGYTDKMNKNDIRIAFRRTTNPIDFVTTIIHEGGHGIFEQNISHNLAKYENKITDNIYALHESQSRFFENILGRNKNFWIPIYDDIKKILNLKYSLDEFVSLLNTPKCSPIRIMADELTYCMHIILRYEIERDIFRDKINVSEIPKIWNKKAKEYLNITIKNDSDGLLQDIHWSNGDFGYFPSYLIGSIYDGMLIEAIEKNLGNIDELLKNGKIKEITNYLINNVYINGGAYTSLEVIKKICNKDITAKPLINYFKNKYDKQDKQD